MNKGLSDYLRNNSRSLESDYVDLPALRDDLLGLKSALSVEHRILESRPEEREERISNISDIKILIARVNAVIDLFPPYPELPPTRPLIKISGVVEELTVRTVIGYFATSEYSTQKAAAEKKRNRDNAGAVLVMITQLLAGTVIHARVNDGERKKSRCIYLEGKVGGKKFSGWLAKTNVRVGDYMEMAVMPCEGEYKIYAIANPQQRTISTTPKCSIGINHLSYIKMLHMTAILTTFMFLFVAGFFPDNLINVVIAWGIVTLGLNYVIHRGVIQDEGAPCLLMVEICKALGIPDGENVKLSKITKNKIEQLKLSGEWLPPEKQMIEMPRGLAKGFNDYFYYY